MKAQRPRHPPGRREPRVVPALGRSALTALYDPVVGLTMRERRFRDALLADAGLDHARRVLDIGCGTASFGLLVTRRRPHIEFVGLDADPRVLAIARRKADRANARLAFVLGRADELPFPDGCFDRVCSSLVFHHLTTATKQRAGAEIRRVLAPRGELVMADWTTPSNGLMRALFRTVQALDGPDTTKDNVEGRLPDLLRAGGLTNVAETRRFATVYGSLGIYRARRAPIERAEGPAAVADGPYHDRV